MNKEELLEAIEKAQENIQAAESDYGNLLRKYQELFGSTFCQQGKWYQIRHRKISKNGKPITYLCNLPSDPKEWLSGPRGKDESELKIDDNEVAAVNGTVVIE